MDERSGLDHLFDEDDGDDPFVPRVLPVAAPNSAHRIPSKYRRSAGASVLAASMLGLRDVIEPPKDDEPVVEQEAAEGDRQRPVEVYLDPDDPAASIVVIRNPADSN